jgi:hypothetical protein
MYELKEGRMKWEREKRRSGVSYFEVMQRTQIFPSDSDEPIRPTSNARCIQWMGSKIHPSFNLYSFKYLYSFICEIYYLLRLVFVYVIAYLFPYSFEFLFSAFLWIRARFLI